MKKVPTYKTSVKWPLSLHVGVTSGALTIPSPVGMTIKEARSYFTAILHTKETEAVSDYL